VADLVHGRGQEISPESLAGCYADHATLGHGFSDCEEGYGGEPYTCSCTCTWNEYEHVYEYEYVYDRGRRARAHRVMRRRLHPARAAARPACPCPARCPRRGRRGRCAG